MSRENDASTDESKYNAIPDARRAIDFLTWLNPGADIYLEYLNSEGPSHPKARRYAPSEAESAVSYVASNNSGVHRRNIHFLANADFLSGERKKENFEAAEFLHADLDCKDYPGSTGEQHEAILAALFDRRPKGIPSPTAVWFTGGGYQALWRLVEPISVEEAEWRNAALLSVLQGGPGTHDVGRLLRLPHTTNWLNKTKKAAGRTPAVAAMLEPVDFSRPPRAYQLLEFKLKRLKSENPKAVIALQNDVSAIEPMEVPDDITHVLPSDPVWHKVILTGQNPPGKSYRSRSELVLAATLWMLTQGVQPGHVLSIITDARFGISEHVRGNPNTIAYGRRQVTRAQEFLEARGGSWPVTDDKGAPHKGDPSNVRHAIWLLAIGVQRNTFTGVDEVSGQNLGDRDLNDIFEILSSEFTRKLKFGASPAQIKREILALAHERPYHPVRDYLDGLEWDGVPRLDTWLHDYCGAERSELNAEFGRKVLIAGVRRIKQPGVKFDTMLVLEGSQGVGKSRLAAMLAIREEWFCGSLDLRSDDKTKAELLSRAWIVECQELDGLNRSTAEGLKRFLSTSTDSYRQAYARTAGEYPRHCIIIGTTNEEGYLRDLTGNRRIWPVRVREIDTEGFRRIVDQLWAEAVVREQAGESLALSRSLWGAAREAQGARLAEDAYADQLADAFADRVGKVSTESLKLLLGLSTSRMTPSDTRRIRFAMQAFGWVEGTYSFVDPSGDDRRSRKGYRRPNGGSGEVEWIARSVAGTIRLEIAPTTRGEVPF